MVETFGERLSERIDALGPLCVGIDPSSQSLAAWGRDDSPEGLEFFAMTLVEAALDNAAAIKPQIAHFERFGARGFLVLERVLAEARDAEVLVVADVKRGDIGASNEGYAQAWLGEESPLRADALTVHPYLGVDSLAPFFMLAAATGRGVFVLAATSNDEGRSIQRAYGDDHEFVEDLVLRSVAQRNQRDDGRGSLGVVLGATRDRPRFELSALGGPILVPGVGAQGAGAQQVAQLLAPCPRATVLVNVSRAIASVGPERPVLSDTIRRWRDELATALL
ncbi:MAG TPA: orotidine-5'-phosphate decarboxylase [Acidimicrobiales bacterium]|nr:orotidine-5'-phosphate decarboxylase [Acidimicrobiales bacterium]